MKHDYTKDHNIRHVNGQWITEYLEQFKIDPS